MLADDIRARKRAASARRAIFYSAVCIPFLFFLFAWIFFNLQGTALWLFIVLLLAYTILVVTVMLVGRHRIKIIERALKAGAVPPSYLNGLQERVEEICIACGRQSPTLRYIERDNINAYAVRSDGNGTIFFTKGILKSLNHDEIRAVIAHAVARLDLGYSIAIDLRTTLAAIPAMLRITMGSLLGLAASAMGIVLFLLTLFALLPALIFSATENGIWLFIYYVVFVPITLIIYRLIDSGVINSYNQFFLADAAAVKLTMRVEPLVDALHKAEGSEGREGLSFIQGLAFAPYSRRRDPWARNAPTPVVISGGRETNMPFPMREPENPKTPFPSVEDRISKLARAFHRPFY